MSSRIAFPFLTLRDRTVTSPGWLVGLGEGDLHPADDHLPDWDYATPVRLMRTISIDRDAAARDLEYRDEELSLRAVVRIGTGLGRIPRRTVLTDAFSFEGDRDQITFDLLVPGERLSASLDIRTCLVVEQPADLRGELSPARPFERVWQDVTRIRLEGEEPRFPIEIAELRLLLGDSMAGQSPWYLHWSTADWSRDFHGAMRLYLNSSCQDFIARVEQEDPETLRALMGDVMSQVCEGLLSENEAEVEAVLESCDPGSLGQQASAWLKQAWPGRDLAYLRSLLSTRPGRFRAAFLGLATQKEAGE